MALQDDLTRVAAAAAAFAEGDEQVAGVIAAEPSSELRLYLCAFVRDGTRTWLALDPDGRPVESRALVRDAFSIAALCEVAEENAAGGDLDDLRSRLVALRLTENPPGIDEAEEAVVALQHTLRSPQQVAPRDRLDQLGAATRRLEQALGEAGASPFAEAMKSAMPAVEALASEIEANYKRELL